MGLFMSMSRMVTSLSCLMTSHSMSSSFVDPGRLNFTSSFSFLVFKGFSVRIYIHTSLLTYLRPEFCLIWAAGGVGGLRGDVTGVGYPSDALKDPSDDLGNLSADFGASQ